MARRALAICVLLLVAGCGSSSSSDNSGPSLQQPHWPAPSHAMALAKKAGLVPERAEFLQYHVHAHLDVFVDGKPVVVPAGIVTLAEPALLPPVGIGPVDRLFRSVSPPPSTASDEK